ncbi:MAG: proton-conducting transporter membrane subunit, partial [Planctomycetota bacterium]
AAFPLWFWLPEVYPTLPPTLGGLYAGLLTKVGVYALVRLLCMCMGGSDLVLDVLTTLVLISACGTMFLGVLGAVGSGTIRRILSIHVISQVGYMIFGIGLCMAALRAGDDLPLARLAVAATLLYMVQHMIVKCALFLCCGMIEKYAGTDDLDGMGALLQRDKWLATVFLIAALSLVGLPPLSGFFGKFLLIRGGFELGGGAGITLSIFAIVTGALTLLSMAKIWSYGFWSPPPAASRTATLPLDFRPPKHRQGLLAVSSLVVLALSVGLGAQWYFNIASAAAETIVDPTAYVRAVLGENAAQLIPKPPTDA